VSVGFLFCFPALSSHVYIVAIFCGLLTRTLSASHIRIHVRPHSKKAPSSFFSSPLHIPQVHIVAIVALFWSFVYPYSICNYKLVFLFCLPAHRPHIVQAYFGFFFTHKVSARMNCFTLLFRAIVYMIALLCLMYVHKTSSCVHLFSLCHYDERCSVMHCGAACCSVL